VQLCTTVQGVQLNARKMLINISKVHRVKEDLELIKYAWSNIIMVFMKDQAFNRIEHQCDTTFTIAVPHKTLVSG